MYRHLGTDRSCPRSAGPVESINHLLFECPPSPSGLGFIGLSVPSGLLPEYIHISKHELPVFEEKRSGSAETTIRYLPMDLLVHLEGEERQTLQWERRTPIDTLQHASLEAECWRKANEKEEANEDHDDPPTTEIETMPPWIP